MTSKVNFEGNSFCFTGKLAELKRTQVEREARARGSITIDTVNKDLDYLVIGSIPAVGWKHGNYGRKIEKAMELQKINSGKPILVSENEFMEALENTPEINSGEIDAKVIVCKYHFIAFPEDIDAERLYDWLEMLQEAQACHVSVTFEDMYYLKLFSDSLDLDDNIASVKCRIVKQLELSDNSQQFIDDIAKGFEAIKGVDGRLRWFEKKEGSASYLRLLKEIPKLKRRIDI